MQAATSSNSPMIASVRNCTVIIGLSRSIARLRNSIRMVWSSTSNT
nr:MAG TPA: hypothetical protein [Caudoviricetes sp.]